MVDLFSKWELLGHLCETQQWGYISLCVITGVWTYLSTSLSTVALSTLNCSTLHIASSCVVSVSAALLCMTLFLNVNIFRKQNENTAHSTLSHAYEEVYSRLFRSWVGQSSRITPWFRHLCSRLQATVLHNAHCLAGEPWPCSVWGGMCVWTYASMSVRMNSDL